MMSFSGDMAREKHADMLRQADEQALIHEARTYQRKLFQRARLPVPDTEPLLVRVVHATHGMPVGSEGFMLPSPDPNEVIVRFWDGGPLKVPRNAVEVI